MKKMNTMLAVLLCLCLAAGCLSGCRSAEVAEITLPETTVPETTAPVTEPIQTEPPETTVPIVELPATEPSEPAEASEPESVTFDLYATVVSDGLATVLLPENIIVSTDGYYEAQGWHLVARSDEVVILGAREDRALYESHGVEFPETLEDYISYITSINPIPNELTQVGERYCTTYEGRMNGETKFFYLMLAQGEDAYWMVHFICDPELADRYVEEFALWAQLMMLR